MSPFTKKIAGAVGAVLATAYGTAITVSSYIGLTTTPDDAAALQQKLPPIITWLMHTPWWVAVGLWLVAVAYMAWAFWPSHRLDQELAASRSENKAALEKAWEFRNEYLADKERLNTALAEIKTSIEQFDERRKEDLQNFQNALVRMEAELRMQMQSESQIATASFSAQFNQMAHDNMTQAGLLSQEINTRLDMVRGDIEWRFEQLKLNGIEGLPVKPE